ncbi:LysR family transcriptional regulator [Sphingomonas sp. QA11]|uniref:LysR family transcriptional regulator n=1 Tax=Sphingomonas sp. QA11 TaxID=2950605 RepID=UPI00234AE0F2|nr:LysR family transcriptional regulator [Sphingomonas sp. QA11]WCM29397.1 LysR family transcriptional regulator [Sphingomonas sp. QA11]
MKLRPSSLETLRIFEACARNESFTRAAVEIGISPAAVSQRMRSLRTELGTLVFERNGPRITLTDAGRRLADKVGDAMAQLAGAVEECANADIMRVSAAPSFASRWLAPRLASFTDRHNIAVTLDPAIDIRAPGRFDVSVRSGRGNWKGYEATALFPVERTPLYNPQCYRPARIARPADLLACRLIDSDDWPNWFALAGLSPPPGRLSSSAARYPTQDLAGAAVIEGGGVALLSPRLFDSAIAEGRLVQPFDVVLSGPEAYWALISDRESRVSVVAFRDWLVAICRNPNGS